MSPADGPGSAGLEHLADLIAVMDRLRSPGGCPWDAEQTAESLVAYAVEEVYEVAEAVETGDRAHLREELGDLLLQVVFQARVAQEHPTEPFDLEDVAAGIAAKLRRRHPHVFGPDADAGLDPEEVHRRWERIKAEEKAERTSALDGIPVDLPALARAQKALGRLRRAGLTEAVAGPETAGPPASQAELGEELLALVRRADAAGVDAEAALRGAVRALEDRARAAERAAATGPDGA